MLAALRLITAQLRRSALPIAPNIAEGCGKDSRTGTLRYLEIAAGSAAETQHHLLVAKGNRAPPALKADAFLKRIASIRRMLYSLSK